jgi:hypothetical protein
MLIPCHRVVHSDGTHGRIPLGPELKRRLIAWEAAAAPLGKVKAPRLVCKATGPCTLTDEREDGEA